MKLIIFQYEGLFEIQIWAVFTAFFKWNISRVIKNTCVIFYISITWKLMEISRISPNLESIELFPLIINIHPNKDFKIKASNSRRPKEGFWIFLTSKFRIYIDFYCTWEVESGSRLATLHSKEYKMNYFFNMKPVSRLIWSFSLHFLSEISLAWLKKEVWNIIYISIT